jgi:hypothetical protein
MGVRAFRRKGHDFLNGRHAITTRTLMKVCN